MRPVEVDASAAAARAQASGMPRGNDVGGHPREKSDALERAGAR
jgi:hypothetical protein